MSRRDSETQFITDKLIFTKGAINPKTGFLTKRGEELASKLSFRNNPNHGLELSVSPEVDRIYKQISGITFSDHLKQNIKNEMKPGIMRDVRKVIVGSKESGSLNGKFQYGPKNLYLYPLGIRGEGEWKDTLMHEIGHSAQSRNRDILAQLVKDPKFAESVSTLTPYVDWVRKQNNIKTQYGLRTYIHEVFADAFKLFQRNPEILEIRSPKLFNIFQGLKGIADPVGVLSGLADIPNNTQELAELRNKGLMPGSKYLDKDGKAQQNFYNPKVVN